MRASRVLVTGGAGFIGSHLVNRLMREGLEVVVLDNLFSGRVENVRCYMKQEGFHLVKGDIRKPKDVTQAVSGVDAVFHLAALTSVPISMENPSLVNDVNVGGTLNVLEASLKTGVKRLIYASSGAVYGEAKYLPIDEEHPTLPFSPYGVSKLAAEGYCRVFYRQHGLETLSLRFFNVYGPRQAAGPYAAVINQFIARLRHGRPLTVFGDGQQTRDFVHISDVAEACMLALTCRRDFGEALNIGVGKPVTVNELAQTLTELMGSEATNIVYAPPRKGDIRDSWADIGKAEAALGYKPKVTLRKGLETLLKQAV